MTTRERWTVYPLLFLAIGLALRGVAVPPETFSAGMIEAARVTCGELVVASDDGTKLVHIGRVKGGGGGRIEINDRTGTETVAIGTRPENRDGVLEFFDATGAAAARIDGESWAAVPRSAHGDRAGAGVDQPR